MFWVLASYAWLLPWPLSDESLSEGYYSLKRFKNALHMINLNINKVNPQIDFYSTVDYETVCYR